MSIQSLNHWCVVLPGLPPDTLQGHRDRFLEQFKKYDPPADARALVPPPPPPPHALVPRPPPSDAAFRLPPAG